MPQQKGGAAATKLVTDREKDLTQGAPELVGKLVIEHPAIIKTPVTLADSSYDKVCRHSNHSPINKKIVRV